MTPLSIESGDFIYASQLYAKIILSKKRGAGMGHYG
jgi:hypothetical protein